MRTVMRGVRGAFAVSWDGFPQVLTKGDELHVTEGEWRARIVAEHDLVFANPEAVLRHMVAHTDEWTGDVFPIISILTERLDEFRECAWRD